MRFRHLGGLSFPGLALADFVQHVLSQCSDGWIIRTQPGDRLSPFRGSCESYRFVLEQSEIQV